MKVNKAQGRRNIQDLFEIDAEASQYSDEEPNEGSSTGRQWSVDISPSETSREIFFGEIQTKTVTKMDKTNPEDTEPERTLNEHIEEGCC